MKVSNLRLTFGRGGGKSSTRDFEQICEDFQTSYPVMTKSLKLFVDNLM